MAVHTDDDNAQQTSNNNASTSQPAAQVMQTREAQPFSFGSKFGASGGVSRNSGGEVLNKLLSDIKAFFVTNKTEFAQWDALPLDKNNPLFSSLAYSAVIFTYYAKEEKAVVYHTLIVEASGELPAPRDINNNGQAFKHMHLASDAFDPKYIEMARNVVSSAYPNIKVFGTDAQLLIRNWMEMTTLEAVIRNCSLAAWTKVMAARAQTLTMSAVPAAVQLVTSKTFNNANITDGLGIPVRADILMRLSKRGSDVARQNSTSLNQDNGREELGRISAYVEPIWALDNEPENTMFPNLQQPQAMKPKFMPMVIMTSMEFQAVVPSLEAQILMIRSALTMLDKTTLAMNFKPRPMGKNEVDTTDIGALNIQANLYKETDKANAGSVIDTKSAKFTDAELGTLINMLFRNEFILALRVPEVGADTWFNSPFVAAADGGQNGSRANAEIIAAVDRLLGNNDFSRAFGNQQFVIVDNDRVHMGYYEDAKGHRKDLATIDHLAICNMLGKTNPAAIVSWSDTFFNLNLSLERRLAARKNAIESAVAPTYTGYGRVIKFNPAALSLLLEMFNKIGRSITIDDSDM